ncbi:putative signal sequence receptor alpha chain [Erysiphe neolycopersici]|uniref:Putative signal sequence receptor alpha chain n=1 Tax=Erysiphe neolycopersici TaxID=212602 RepID=A0A420H896_9PEZI|nr:putative signal sequence receptor alpha chain [Erysiphe neolycopersici]
MGFSRITTLVCLTLCIIRFNYAADPAEDKLSPSPNLAVSVIASFPSASDELGLTIFNGHKTKALIEFTNSEAGPIIVSSVKGTLSNVESSPTEKFPLKTNPRNLTASRFNVAIQPGEKQSLTYTFTTDLEPQDLRMNIIATISHQNGSIYHIQAFNKNVTIVDPVASIFDPQIIFLYLFITGLIGVLLFWAYSSWIKPLLPQTKRGVKGSEYVKRSYKLDKASNSPKNQNTTLDSGSSSDTPTVVGTKAYDESWIPDHHIKKPAVKRIKGNSSKMNLKNEISK